MLGGSAVEVHVDPIPELTLSLRRGGGRRLSGHVGARDRHWANRAQHVQGDRLQWHPQHYRAARVTEIPLQRRRLLHHQTQRPGPEGANEFMGRIRHRIDQSGDGVPTADQYSDRHVAAAALSRQQVCHGAVVEGVGGNAVHGVGGQHDEPSTLDRIGCRGDGLRAIQRIAAVQHPGHR